MINELSDSETVEAIGNAPSRNSKWKKWERLVFVSDIWIWRLQTFKKISSDVKLIDRDNIDEISANLL
uniref:Uncharacterized protein n=1 Tax=Megaselia scalaris TaxID=36166 RepID=T1GT18_MEGSC